MVQGSLSYAAAASPSRGAAVVDAEMMSTNNAAADDLESDPGFVRNCVRMSAFEKEHYHPNNIMPERPLSAVFAVNQTSENSVKDIFRTFKTLVYLHMELDDCNVFPMTTSVLPLERRTIVTPF